MLTQTSRYALRILGHLADHRGATLRGDEIARATGIPANYLVKLLNQLRKRGFVDSQKGWGGGFRLREQALEAPIAEVVELFDGPADQTTCVFERRRCNESRPCPLHHHWERVRSSYSIMLAAVRLRDLATGGELPELLRVQDTRH